MAEQVEDESTDLLDLNFKQVLREEAQFIDERRRDRAQEAGQRPRFAVALSGGGIRAAAFQAGVLWRLAESGHLKDVDYLAAVSGGAYIASAFASHVAAEKPPEKASEVDSWYVGVMAKVLCRMQRNAGGFVRDPEQECPPDTGSSGMLPRWLDAPVLTAAVMLTLVINPIELLFVYLVPITEGTQLFFGAALRKAYCDPDGLHPFYVLMQWSAFGKLLTMVMSATVITFVLWLMSNLPLFSADDQSSGKKQNPKGYLVIQGSLAFLTRFIICIVVYMLLLLSVPAVQQFSYPPELLYATTGQYLGAFCQRYVLVNGAKAAGTLSSPVGSTIGCANYYQGKAWFEDDYIVSFYRSAPDVSQTLPGKLRLNTTLAREAPDYPVVAAPDSPPAGRPVMSAIFSVLLLLGVISAMLVPFVPELFLGVLSFAGPTVTFGLIVLFVQYRTYGPLTGQPLFWNWGEYDYTEWERFVYVAIAANFVLAFFFNDFRRVWHWFYSRSLRLNFFEQSRDWRFAEVKNHAYCPFVVYTGTVSDYKRPGDDTGINEISFSGLHTGGPATGYVRTPNYQTLATCTALSGAGCLDAISLSMVNHLKFRFWLEMLNLSWGDFILFTRRGSAVARSCRNRVGEKFERSFTWITYRAPGCLCWGVMVSLFWSGLLGARRNAAGDCTHSKHVAALGICLALALFALSFLAFLEPLEFLMFNPIIRQMQQATRYCFQSYQPPGMLYVTDGGVRDCTAILQLMRRRCERILLVLAAGDPCDELSVLRVAMEAAVEDRIGSFYDPEDPKRDIRIALETFRDNPEQAYLHLGIRYGWGPKDDGSGDLFIVKNRLPPSLAGAAVRPLLTEEEVKGQGISKDFGPYKDTWAGLQTAELGGFGCCDCCHRRGCNCGAKFPHLTGANYLYLTPMLFSSLSRLGFEVSKDVVERVAR